MDIKERREKRAEEIKLVHAAQDGDKEAFRILLERSKQRVYATAFEILRSQEDAEDVTQEAFVKAYLSLKSFRGDSSFITWMYRIVYNMCIDMNRQLARRGGPAAEYDENQASRYEYTTTGRVPAPEERMFRQEQAEHIKKAMDNLSEEHRRAIWLREVQGLSYDEIAETLKVSRGTVMSRLFYARKRMQEALQEFAPPGALNKTDDMTQDESVN